MIRSNESVRCKNVCALNCAVRNYPKNASCTMGLPQAEYGENCGLTDKFPSEWFYINSRLQLPFLRGSEAFLKGESFLELKKYQQEKI